MVEQLTVAQVISPIFDRDGVRKVVGGVIEQPHGVDRGVRVAPGHTSRIMPYPRCVVVAVPQWWGGSHRLAHGIAELRGSCFRETSRWRLRPSETCGGPAPPGKKTLVSKVNRETVP